ncbi:MAG: SDR family oxidoreductase [Spirosomataceae bacterium]
MQKVLITGANGLLGQKLVSLYAQDSNTTLVATARGANRLPISDLYTYMSMDITQKEDVMRVISEEKPDVVIHTAAMTNVDQCEVEKEACWAQNVYAVSYLVEACQAVDAFLVHLSTDFIFDGANGPYTEEATANPLSFYGWSKLAAEHILLHSSVRWSIARTVLVYGIAHDMSRSNIILWVKKSLEEGKTIRVVTDQWRTPTLAEDLAVGCQLIADQRAEGIFNISGEELLTPYEMAQQTAAFFGLDATQIQEADGSTFQQTAKRPAKTGFNLTKSKAVLGYSPRSFREGIALLASQL